jgi:acetyl-CoA C-acetyltransferase
VRKVALVAGGLAKWGVRKATWKELVQEAGKALFDDAPDLDRREVDALFVGAAQPERFAFQAHAAPMVAEQLGLSPRTLMRTEMACASGQMAIKAAAMHIAAGLSDIALVVGVEKMNAAPLAEGQTSMTCVLDREWDGVHGGSAPPFFAMVAQRRMRDCGTTREQMAAVSVKNHRFSSTNPYAHFQKLFTLEKVLSSPVVAPPLTLLDCSGITDGAGAVLLTTAEMAGRFTDRPAHLWAYAQAVQGNNVANLGDITQWPPCAMAAREAYRLAGIGPDDVDLAELHDCFTISEIIEYEAFGFCPKGEGGRFVEEGQSDVGGKVAVNTRGGLLGTGHPLGATGLGQAIEVLWQFQSRVPAARQVADPEVAVSHNLSGAANAHAVTVYGRDPR